MVTSKMKAARMLMAYGAGNKRVARIIGMRRTKKLRNKLTSRRQWEKAIKHACNYGSSLPTIQLTLEQLIIKE